MGLFDSLSDAAEAWELDALLTLPLDSSPASTSTAKSSVCPAKDTAKPKQTKAVKWTAEEDQKLKLLVPKLKPDWTQIAANFPGRPKSAVKRRWENRFDPEIKKDPWTSEEDLMIVTLLERIGPIWKEISVHLPGRPPDIIKNRYYGHIKRQPVPPQPVTVCSNEPDWESLLSLPEEKGTEGKSKEDLKEEIAMLEKKWKEAKSKLLELEGDTPSTED